MIELSGNTRVIVRRLFSPADQAEAEQLLIHECADNVPFCEDATPETMERIRFAALKTSGGSLAGLCDGIQLAQRDWRDLLMAAGFAEDIGAHDEWRRTGCQPDAEPAGEDSPG